MEIIVPILLFAGFVVFLVGAVIRPINRIYLWTRKIARGVLANGVVSFGAEGALTASPPSSPTASTQ